MATTTVFAVDASIEGGTKIVGDTIIKCRDRFRSFSCARTSFGAIKKTYGCLRAYDQDIEKFDKHTTKLQLENKQVTPGSVIIKDDLEQI